MVLMDNDKIASCGEDQIVSIRERNDGKLCMNLSSK